MSNFLQSSDSAVPCLRWKSQEQKWALHHESEQAYLDTNQFIFDFDSLKVGWLKILVADYDEVLTHDQENIPDRPAETYTDREGRVKPAYKRGFSINVLLGKEFAEPRLLKYAANQQASVIAMGSLEEQYRQQKDSNVGKVPVVTHESTQYLKNKVGGTNVPQLVITSWVDRPQELQDAGGSSAPAPVDTNNAPSQPVQQPAQQVVAGGGVSEF